jgi:hypothetical protein
MCVQFKDDLLLSPVGKYEGSASHLTTGMIGNTLCVMSCDRPTRAASTETPRRSPSFAITEPETESTNSIRAMAIYKGTPYKPGDVRFGVF